MVTCIYLFMQSICLSVWGWLEQLIFMTFYDLRHFKQGDGYKSIVIITTVFCNHMTKLQRLQQTKDVLCSSPVFSLTTCPCAIMLNLNLCNHRKSISWSEPKQSRRAHFRPGPRVSQHWQTGEGTNETVSILKQANGLMNVESSA